MLAAAAIALSGCAPPLTVVFPPVVLGQRPIRPVPAFGSVWVANAADGTVQRVDPATGTTAATIRVADPQVLLAAGCAPSSEHAYATGSFGLRGCDAPSAVAAGAGAIWAVANDANAVVRVDPARNAVSGTVPLGFNAWSVAVSGDAVWVTDYVGDAVVRVDPRTLRVVARIALPSGPTELAIDGTSLWVVCSAAAMLARIDTSTNTRTATVPVGVWALAVATAGDDVWVRGGSTRTNGGLYHVDARTNTSTTVYDAGSPQGREGVGSIATTPRGVWVPGVTLDLIDPATGATIASYDVASYAVAVDGDVLWVLDVFGRLRRLRS